MTRKHSDHELLFAAALGAEIDAEINKLLALLGIFDREVREAADRGDSERTLLAIGTFLAAFEALVNGALIANSAWMARELQSRFGGQLTALTAQDSQAQAQLLITTTRRLIEENRDMALLMISSTGTGFAGNFGSILTRGDLNSIRNATDFALAQSIERDGHEMGRGIFPGKAAVATLDDVTTDLCGNRMNGQVRAWDELYVDPVSGASWMFPPFVGAGLPRRESWHPCRSVSVPLLRL